MRFGVSPFRSVNLFGHTHEGHGAYAIVPSLDWWALEHGATAADWEAFRKDSAAFARAEREMQGAAE